MEIICTLPLEISVRHIHLSKSDLNILYGDNYELRELRKISMVGQYAAKETVLVRGKGAKEIKVRVVGPPRKYSLLELTFSDLRFLGYDYSAELIEGLKTNKMEVSGISGSVSIDLTVPLRHVHLNTEFAREHNLSNGQLVNLSFTNEFGGILKNAQVRIADDFNNRVHLNTDEANALRVRDGQKVKIIKPSN